MMVSEEKGTEMPQESMEQVAAPKTESTPQVEKLVVQETGREKVHERYQEILSKVTPGQQTTSDDDAVVHLDAKHIGALTDEESKVQKLLDLAGTKGVVHAVKVARSLKDYYALDRLHDELADKLYQGLVEKGLIEKE
jgi:hypothetical protein